MTLSFLWRFLLCVGVGQGLLWWLARSPDDRRLRHVVLASFWLRVGLASLLYAISSYQWPVLSSLQAREGFWTFALDARLYHAGGEVIANAWKQGIELPDPGMPHDYLTLIAAVYRLLGTNPLYAMLLHAWLGALTGWLAYRIGQRLFDKRTALRAAFLVSFWPSAVLWSTQILRDVVSWCLALTILWLVILMVGSDARPFRVRWRRLALQAVALAVTTILLTRLRVYLGSILVLTALLTFVPVACGYLVDRQVGRAVWHSIWVFLRRVGQLVRRCLSLIGDPVGRALGLGSVAALMISAVVTARALDIKFLVSPAHPEQGHVRLGLQHQQRGELTLAETEFRRAIDLRPDHEPAYLRWADMLAAANRPREAFQVCASWPGPSSDGTVRRCRDQVDARVAEQRFPVELDAPEVSPLQALAVLPGGSTTPGASRPKSGVRFVPKPQKMPELEAGPPQTVCCKPQSVLLQGYLLGKGWPKKVEYRWIQFEGPPALIATPDALATQVRLTKPGTYRFQLTASAGQEFARKKYPMIDETMITLTQNTPPQVEAGPPQTVGKPESIHLRGQVQDDGWPSDTLTYHWAQSLGPPAHIVTPTALETKVDLPELGTYHFSLTVSDGHLSSHDEVSVTVVKNKPPTVEIVRSPEITVYSQTEGKPQSIGLLGEVQDDGWPIPHTLTYHWAQSLGPPAYIVTPTALETEVDLPELGTYHFSLTVSDGELSGQDKIRVILSAELSSLIAPVAPGPERPTAAIEAKPLIPASKLGHQGLAILSEMSPQWLGTMRSSVIVAGGNALVDTDTNISQPLALIMYLPRALLIGFLAPFPWQRFDTSGSTGGMRVFAGAEAALVYLLLIGLARRAWGAVRLFGLIGCVRLAIQRTQLGRLFLLVYGLAVAASASLVTANVGTLFRLRLLFWLPLLILVAAGDPLGAYPWYRWLVHKVDAWYRWLVHKVTGRRGAPLPLGELPQEAEATTDPASVVDVGEGRRE